jgi:hypothetical protein
MNLQERIDLLVNIGAYMQENTEAWQIAKRKAHAENSWFVEEFIDLSVGNIVSAFLKRDVLTDVAKAYDIPKEQLAPKKVGLVMAGNIPLVGFHDLITLFLSGHIAMVKPSSKDTVLIRHLVQKLYEWSPDTENRIVLRDMLKNCDAYIATGSNNSSRYFEHYFSKYPHIIRRNRTSVALLDGSETPEELNALADDVYQFFGLGCRNVTQLYVPRDYDFQPLLESFRKYNYLINHNKFKNNYDYQLAAQIINSKYYMTNDSILLTENESPFAPIGQVHYQYYGDKEAVENKLNGNASVQCIVGRKHIPFGQAQRPSFTDFADGIDTLSFLLKL